MKIFVSESGNSILIEEIIPNDCGPCTNYILVQALDENLSYEYLALPGNIKSFAIEGESARVTSITDKDVTYRYADGRGGSKSFVHATKPQKRPQFPG